MPHKLGPSDRTNGQGTTTNSSTTTVYDQPEPPFIKETNDTGSDPEHMRDAHDEKAHDSGVNATFEDGVVMESGGRGYMVVFGGFLVSSPLSCPRIPIASHTLVC